MGWRIKRNSWQQDIRTIDYAVAIIYGVMTILIITYLYYHSFWVNIPFLLFLIPYLKKWEYQQESKLKDIFELEFRDYLQALGSALSTGYALENAMKEARNDLKQQYDKNTRIMKDTARMEHLLAMNMSVEQIWLEWAKNTELEVLQEFTTVFIVAKKSGGDSVAIIKKSIQNICEKLEMESELRVLLAGKKYEFYIMSAVPLGIILYMKLAFAEFMSILYHNVFGIFFMSICLAVYVGAFLWGSKIIEIEV